MKRELKVKTDGEQSWLLLLWCAHTATALCLLSIPLKNVDGSNDLVPGVNMVSRFFHQRKF